ncbi:MAG: FtsX-like permease family protein [Acidimicrobiia bacterium]
MWKVTLKGILSKKVRFLLTGVAVMLGVAFISGTFVLTATISQTFDNLFSDIYANTDAVVRAPETFKSEFGDGARGRISADVLPVVRDTEGVSEAAGAVQGFAQIVDKNGEVVGTTDGGGAPTFGFAYNSQKDLSTLTLVDGKAPRAPDQIVIDKQSATDAGYKVGDTVPVITKAGPGEYQLTGIVKFGTSNSLLGATIVAFTPATASEVLGEPGKFDQIDVSADSGVSQNEVVRNIRESLKEAPSLSGEKLEVISGEELTKESQDDIKQGLSFFNTFLLVFGVVALLVGSFIIFNTFSIIVAQRGRELALLRAIGASQRQVISSVLFEAILVGIVASFVGFVAGIGLAGLLKAVLAGFGVDIPANDIVIPANAVIWSFATGLIVTIIAAVSPALRASRIPPIAAMRDTAIDRSATSRVRILSGLIITLLGALFLGLGLFGDAGLPVVGLGAVIVFLGVAVLGPVIASPLSSFIGLPVAKIKGITGSIARENAMRNPKRTSATAAALMIGVGLVGLITIFAASARTSVNAALDSSMKADYIVTSSGFGPGTIPLTAAEQLREVPNVELASGVQNTQAQIGNSVDQLRAADPAEIDQLFDLHVSQGSLEDLGATSLAVQENTAKDKNLKVGSEVKVLFAGGEPQTFTVDAIFTSTGFANYVTSTEAYLANTPDPFDSEVYIKTTGGVTPANTAAIKQVMRDFPGPKVRTADEFKAAQAGQINQILNLIYVLLFFAIMIALFGIANTLGLSIIERRHELGLLRAVGMSRRQLRSSVRWEAVIIALLGTFLGLVIGVAFAWAMVRALRDEGIDKFSLAPGQLVVIVVLAALFGVLAAAWPARRAARLDVLQSIKTE